MISDDYFLFSSLFGSLFVRMKKAHQQPIDRWLNSSFFHWPMTPTNARALQISQSASPSRSFCYFFIDMADSVSGQLKRFDAYAKTLDDFRVRTTSGGLMTIVSSLIIFFLFILELKYFLNTDIVQVLFVDTSRQEKMNITIDIEFLALPCSYLTVDAMDISGDSQTDIAHNLYKTRLDSQGKPMADDKVKVSLQPLPKGNLTQLNNAPAVAATTVADCESCYGAESAAFRCCPTCDDVKSAYRTKGWSFNPSEFSSSFRSN